jgi:FlaA1/EpsC-like NDP-sugar epimerase
MAFVHDLAMIPAAWLLAYWLRFNLGPIPDVSWHAALTSLMLVIPIQAAVFWLFGLYRGVWRFASLPDLVRISKAAVIGTLLSMGAIYFLNYFQGVPRSAPVLYLILLIFLLSAPRFAYRWIKDYWFNLRRGQRVLIVGAGRAGEMLARDLLRDRARAYYPVAFIDDAREKRGKEIHGIRVYGRCGKMKQIANGLSIDVIVLAVPSASAEEMQRLVGLAEKCHIPFQTLPQLDDLAAGQVGASQLREVFIEDLLGREPVSLDWPRIRSGLTGKVILVTGAGGSIGTELCHQIADLEPAALILYENSEFNIYSSELSLREQYPHLSLHSHLGDVTDPVATERVFERYRPQVVFHAAAYKHVPILENQVREAIRNNVLGTQIQASAAHQFGCSEFVLISTDKAVNPANVMGASKRVAEIYCQNLNAHSTTCFITVRFGNVLGSAGSVVPLFRRQIKSGGPVTVTHPKMERYFMTVREACQLIMQASVLGKGGEIFVLDMGEPIRITTLAEQMIRLSGKIPGEEIRIEYTGLRPGEKLYEELFHEQEELMPTSHDQILLARHREMSGDMLNRKLKDMRSACDQYDTERLSELLNWFVPERIKPRIEEEKVKGAVVRLVKSE